MDFSGSNRSFQAAPARFSKSSCEHSWLPSQDDRATLLALHPPRQVKDRAVVRQVGPGRHPLEFFVEPERVTASSSFRPSCQAAVHDSWSRLAVTNDEKSFCPSVKV
jgi:hypothetical protein